MNDTASMKVGHRPVDLLNALILIVPLGIFMMPLPMKETNISNVHVGTIITLIAIGWLISSIAKKTDWRTTAVSQLLFFVGVVLSIILLLAVMVMFSDSGKTTTGKR